MNCDNEGQFSESKYIFKEIVISATDFIELFHYPFETFAIETHFWPIIIWALQKYKTIKRCQLKQLGVEGAPVYIRQNTSRY